MRRLRERLPPPAIAAALGAASLLVLAFAPAQYLGRQEDDLLYYLAAKALWTGRYELLTAVGHPPLTSTAPGWPLLLAPLALLDAPGPAQAFAALLLAAAPWLIWFWLKRRIDEGSAALVALLCASSPLGLSQSGTLMPEPAYLLVLLLSLMAAERGRHGAAGALAALLLLVRPAGASALPALSAQSLLQGRWRDAARALLPALAAAAAWSAWSWARSSSVQEARELALAYGGQGSSPAAVALENLRFFLETLGGQYLPPVWAAGAPAIAMGALLSIGAAAGLLRSLRRQPADPAALALLGAALMHALWTWRYERYLIPLLPLALWALAAGLGRAAKPALGALLALQLGGQTLPRLGRVSPWAEPELARTYAWLRAQPGAGALASALPVRDGWHAGRPCLALPARPDAREFAAALKDRRAAYVLRQDGLDLGLSAGASAPLLLLLSRAYAQLEDRGLFRLVHEEPGERARVYEPL